ncbi:hypothetical protein ACR6C2_11270 [Streptomyces sp. INA 01156]
MRQQLGLGRLLPLGGARDGAWISEAAAAQALRRAVVRDAPDVRVDGVRIALADPQDAGEPAAPPPPSALPPGALRVTVRFAATAAEPLPVTADRLRAVLSRAAAERIGLVVAEVDLRVTELLGPRGGPPPVRCRTRRAGPRADPRTGRPTPRQARRSPVTPTGAGWPPRRSPSRGVPADGHPGPPGAPDGSPAARWGLWPAVTRAWTSPPWRTTGRWTWPKRSARRCRPPCRTARRWRYWSRRSTDALPGSPVPRPRLTGSSPVPHR